MSELLQANLQPNAAPCPQAVTEKIIRIETLALLEGSLSTYALSETAPRPASAPISRNADAGKKEWSSP